MLNSNIANQFGNNDCFANTGTAKKSDFGRKFKRCGTLGILGFGVGAAPSDPNRLRNGAIGAGVVGLTCLFIK